MDYITESCVTFGNEKIKELINQSSFNYLLPESHAQSVSILQFTKGIKTANIFFKK